MIFQWYGWNGNDRSWMSNPVVFLRSLASSLSFQSPLPWSTCANWWNSARCHAQVFNSIPHRNATETNELPPIKEPWECLILTNGEENTLMSWIPCYKVLLSCTTGANKNGNGPTLIYLVSACLWLMWFVSCHNNIDYWYTRVTMKAFYMLLKNPETGNTRPCWTSVL